MVRFSVDLRLPERVCISNPNHYMVDGWIFSQSRLKKLSLLVGSEEYPASLVEKLRSDVARAYQMQERFEDALFSGFSIPVVLHPVAERLEQTVTLRALFADGTTFESPAGNITRQPWVKQNMEITTSQAGAGGLLAICMATYNPNPALFTRQIESLRRQTYANWICLITDDSSDPESQAFIQNTISGDSRFFYFANQERLGFYHNFERCLTLVPESASYIAFCDQDDAWYPEKLQRCVEQFKGDVQLVYCDMRVVTEHGEVVSNSYWKNRKNYYQTSDLDLLAMVNTVTGAASVFRASLLARILPFPFRYGNVFHDNWTAVLAAACGGIAYIDQPLYDYIQTGTNVWGHSDFRYQSVGDYLRHLRSTVPPASPVESMNFWRRIRRGLSRLFYSLACIFSYMIKFDTNAMGTVIETASLRGLQPENMSILRRPLHFWGLVKISWKVHRRRETLWNFELHCLSGWVALRVVRYVLAPLKRPLFYLVRKFKPGGLSPAVRGD